MAFRFKKYPQILYDRPMPKKLILLTVVLSLLVGGGVAWYVLANSKQENKTASTIEKKFTHLDIKLKNGRLVGAASTYLVKPGTDLEFNITSDVSGKVGVPTDPPQTINFTESPLVFRATTSKPGTYALTYQADGSKEVMQIGTLVVRGSP